MLTTEFPAADEEYVHLQLLRSVWERPTTERPVLEPLFAAGFHGIELALLLLAEFVSDGRRCGVPLVCHFLPDCQCRKSSISTQPQHAQPHQALPCSRP